jgi:hypothetical protein
MAAPHDARERSQEFEFEDVRDEDQGFYPTFKQVQAERERSADVGCGF